MLAYAQKISWFDALESTMASTQKPVSNSNNRYNYRNTLLHSLALFYLEKANYDVFETTPTSFILTAGHDDFE
jgi:hypothetical protein